MVEGDECRNMGLILSVPDHHDINIRHQDIAMELGTSREVVSRILMNFESKKLILLKRGIVWINDFTLLSDKANQR